MTKLQSLLLIVSFFFEHNQAWVLPSTFRRSTTRLSVVESVSVESLVDHETVGTELSGSIQRWLDAEWMPQDVHRQMGESCKLSYLKCRQTGEHDLMTIMTTVVGDLEEKWQEYDKDAFVGPWDITNYVSDFLTERAGLERCSCSSQIY
ncbi:hypothetical protein FisN_17Lu123 [Fistulifera solaris]|uniref:Uncharacterized protein n=1 Tax=Fistulifera solaris TaxID=1519565 RepID=A0A1Z5K1K3_FISSO|nr:hypothetical protein FisN_17Lu123 [Fistulifera solaris]|eukprot:GAX20127.1 hypothetical protein FisN_17Lu123 [Fistulifera solaris]